MRSATAAWGVAVALAVSGSLVGCTSDAVGCDEAPRRAHATIESIDVRSGDVVWSATTRWLFGTTYEQGASELVGYPYGSNDGPTHVLVNLSDGHVEEAYGTAPFLPEGPSQPVVVDGVTVTIQQAPAEGTGPRGPATAVATGADGSVLWTRLLPRPTATQPRGAGNRVVLISNENLAVRCP